MLLGKKNKFDKIERNETYYEAYGEEDGQKKKKKKILDIDTEKIPEKKPLSSKFTYTREKKQTSEQAQVTSTEQTEISKPLISPYVLTLVTLCLAFAVKCLASSKFFLDLVKGKETAASVIMYAVVYIIPSVLFLVLSYKRMHLHYVRRFSPTMFPFSFACLGLVLSVTALQKYFIAYTFSYSEPTVSVSGGLLSGILVSALLPAVCEELFVHGIVQREVSEYAGGLSGILVSAVVFSLLHFELQYFFVYFAASLIMGTLTHVTRSVIPAMIVHFLNNTLSILFSEKLGFIATERIGGRLLMIVIAAICFGFLILCLNIAEKISEKRADKCAKAALSENSDEQDINGDFLCFLSKDGRTFKRAVNVLKTPPMLVCYVIFIITLFLNIA